MRWIRGSLLVVAFATVVALQWVNWDAQRQTQGKLDALLAREVMRPAEPPLPSPAVPAPIPAPAPLAGVMEVPAPRVMPPTGAVPRELGKVALPPYIIEAPDALQIEVAVRDPKTGGLSGLPVQNLCGQFHVRPDGTVGLGLWGSAAVSGLTIDQAATAVREHLANQQRGVAADDLRVVVDVAAMNSKKYYVITDASGQGEQVYAFPITGSDTVMDAVAQVTGLAEAAGKRKMWVARRGVVPGEPWQQLPVDWNGITQHGVTHTNYQIMPGDRLYVKHASD